MRESEAKYHHLFDTMPQGAFVQRADGALVDCNPATLKLLGLSRDEFLGRTSMSAPRRVIDEEGAALPGEAAAEARCWTFGRGVLGTTPRSVCHVGCSPPSRQKSRFSLIFAFLPRRLRR